MFRNARLPHQGGGREGLMRHTLSPIHTPARLHSPCSHGIDKLLPLCTLLAVIVPASVQPSVLESFEERCVEPVTRARFLLHGYRQSMSLVQENGKKAAVMEAPEFAETETFFWSIKGTSVPETIYWNVQTVTFFTPNRVILSSYWHSLPFLQPDHSAP